MEENNKSYIIESINEDVKAFNIKLFIDIEKKIYEKFTPPTLHGYTSECFDKLYLNLLEEIYEYIEEKNYYVDGMYKAIALELVDVICYLGTIINLWSNEDILNNILIRLYSKDDYFDSSSDEVNIGSIVESFNNTTTNLIMLRRRFPERKYHKIKKPLSKEEELNTIGKDIIDECVNLLDVSLNKLYQMSKYNDETFSNLIFYKQSITLNLPDNK